MQSTENSKNSANLVRKFYLGITRTRGSTNVVPALRARFAERGMLRDGMKGGETIFKISELKIFEMIPEELVEFFDDDWVIVTDSFSRTITGDERVFTIRTGWNNPLPNIKIDIDRETVQFSPDISELFSSTQSVWEWLEEWFREQSFKSKNERGSGSGSGCGDDWEIARRVYYDFFVVAFCLN